MYKKGIKGALGFLMVLTVALSARAEARQADLCENDADRYCSNVEPGANRVWQCLKKNEPKLTPACMRLVEKRSVQVEEHEDVQKVCKAERKKHCRYVQWGDGRMKKCLMFHQAEMSDKCRAALE